MSDSVFDKMEIGTEFKCGGKTWRCTDKGTRVTVAIEIGDRERRDPSWLDGPPYALAETVFDEDDMEAIDL